MKDCIIKEISYNTLTYKKENSSQLIEGAGLFAIPGFIDTHIHGAYGADVMDGTKEAIDTMAQSLPTVGTTSFWEELLVAQKKD